LVIFFAIFLHFSCSVEGVARAVELINEILLAEGLPLAYPEGQQQKAAPQPEVVEVSSEESKDLPDSAVEESSVKPKVGPFYLLNLCFSYFFHFAPFL
jgi:hypothetical protein